MKKEKESEKKGEKGDRAIKHARGTVDRRKREKERARDRTREGRAARRSSEREYEVV